MKQALSLFRKRKNLLKISGTSNPRHKLGTGQPDQLVEGGEDRILVLYSGNQKTVDRLSTSFFCFLSLRICNL